MPLGQRVAHTRPERRRRVRDLRGAYSKRYLAENEKFRKAHHLGGLCRAAYSVLVFKADER
jgi:hypothetical protein